MVVDTQTLHYWVSAPRRASLSSFSMLEFFYAGKDWNELAHQLNCPSMQMKRVHVHDVPLRIYVTVQASSFFSLKTCLIPLALQRLRLNEGSASATVTQRRWSVCSYTTIHHESMCQSKLLDWRVTFVSSALSRLQDLSQRISDTLNDSCLLIPRFALSHASQAGKKHGQSQ